MSRPQVKHSYFVTNSMLDHRMPSHRPQGHFHTSNIWQNCPYICTSWTCVSKKSKQFHVFIKFGWNFDAQILKIYKIHWKLRSKQTPVLFCKYLRMESSDLHEILCGGQLLTFELKFQISWRSVHKCECTSCKRAHFIVSARVYDSFADLHEP